jgi:two-component system NtrC family sensor kinase
VRTVATRGLRALGFEVVAAKDGDEALAFGRAERFDAVVCDVVLPGANGFEIVTRLRENQPDLRALFVSGYSAELAARSDTPYLAKPYTPDALAARVRELIEGRG